jgi:hypothetical protein
MKNLKLPKFVSALFHQERVVFWFSSREIFLSWDKRKKQLDLPANSGFADSQIADVDQAAATIAQVLAAEGIVVNQPLGLHKATIFISTASSPLERKLIKQTFKKAGFQRLSLIAYSTALRSFAERQAIRSGIGFYFGHDLSEAMVFSPEEQQSFAVDYSSLLVKQDLQHFLRENYRLETSSEVAAKVYEALAKSDTAQAVRGRNIQTQQLETKTLSAAELEKIASFFKTKLRQELQVLINSSLFQHHQPDQWVIVGDPFLNKFVQQTYQAKTLFLHSELEMIQGVEWL